MISDDSFLSGDVPFVRTSFYKQLKEKLIQSNGQPVTVRFNAHPKSYQQNLPNLVDKFYRRDKLKVQFENLGNVVLWKIIKD